MHNLVHSSVNSYVTISVLLYLPRSRYYLTLARTQLITVKFHVATTVSKFVMLLVSFGFPLET